MITGNRSNIGGQGSIGLYDSGKYILNPYTNPLTSNPLYIYYRFAPYDVRYGSLLNLASNTYDASFTYPKNFPTYPTVTNISTDSGKYVTGISGVPDASGALYCGYVNTPGYTGSRGVQCMSTFVVPQLWTISFWFNTNSTVGGTLWQSYSAMTLSSNQLQYKDNKTNTTYSFNTGTTIAANTWYHIAVTWGGVGNNLNMYLNGTLLSCATSNNTSIQNDILIQYTNETFQSPSYGVSAYNYNLFIGSSNTPSTDNTFGGTGGAYIDEFRLYQGVLSLANITSIYNKTI